MRIMVIIPSFIEFYSEDELEIRRRVICGYASPGTTIDLAFIEGDATVMKANVTADDFAAVTPFIVGKAKEAEVRGYDAVMVHCTIDPGVWEAREVVRIPVIGHGEATYRTASMLGKRVGVIQPIESALPIARDVARKWGMEHLIAYLGAVNIPIPEFSRQIEPQMRAGVIREARRALAAGAEIIFPSGVAIVPIHVNPKDLEAELGVTVLDPDAIGIGLAEYCVRGGLRHAGASGS